MGRLNRDGLIDKKIGAVVRMRRVKSGMSQGELVALYVVAFRPAGSPQFLSRHPRHHGLL